MIDTQTPDTSLADMSLADYRASREGAKTPAVTTPEPAEDRPESTEAKGAKTPEAQESAAPDHADETTEPAEEGDKTEAAKKKGGYQRKIEKAEREIAELKRQLAEKSAVPAADAKQEKTPAPAAAAPKFDKPKPKIADFENLEDYSEALADFKADEREWKREQAAQQAEAKKQADQLVSDWNSRTAEAKKAYADYDEVLDSVSAIAVPAAHQRLFLDSEHGPELAYQLAQDADALKKFVAMAPLQAARYFGKLEATLSTPETPKTDNTKTVSDAPKPIKPVGARASSSAAAPDLAKLSLGDYRRLREAGKLR